MSTWIILAAALVAAILIGCIGGALIGKHMVKRAKRGVRRYLSTRERLVYSVCLVLGIGMIVFGALYKGQLPSTMQVFGPDMAQAGDGMEVPEGDMVEAEVDEQPAADEPKEVRIAVAAPVAVG